MRNVSVSFCAPCESRRIPTASVASEYEHVSYGALDYSGETRPMLRCLEQRWLKLQLSSRNSCWKRRPIVS